jgi:hypothetical protein
MTEIPLFNIQKLTKARFKVVRSASVPSRRLSLSEVRDRAAALNKGLASPARARIYTRAPQAGMVRFDPIHVRPSLWGDAWREILFGGKAPMTSPP